MNRNLMAKASVTVDVPPAKAWQALVNPDAIKHYMFDTNVVTDWHEGSPIVWKGEWQGKSYEDKGVVLQYKPEHALQFTHFSPLSGLPDKPENYHTVTIELSGDGAQTHITLTQDNNPTEQARDHSQKNWVMVFTALKQFLES